MKKLIALLPILTILASCGGKTSDKTNPVNPTNPTSQNSNKSEDNLLEFSGVALESQNIVYDGQAHSLQVSGAPADATVTYEGTNSYTDAGTYTVKATVSKSGYKTLNLTATLTIGKAAMDNVTLNKTNFSIIYDGTDHYNDIVPVGAPANSTTIRTIKNSSNVIVSECVDIGTYKVSISVTNPNYATVTLIATMTIVSNKSELPIIPLGSAVYFSNGLDSKSLYKYDPTASSGKTISYKSYESMKQALPYGDNAIFYASAAVTSSIKMIESSTGEISTIYSTPFINAIATDGSNIYYSTNGLTVSQSGIFRLTITGDTDKTVTVKQIYQGKTHDLTYLDGKLYFANNSNNEYLASISASSNSIVAFATQEVEEKVFNIIAGTDRLYLNVDNLIGNYIASFNPSSSTLTKLSTSQGDYLTLAGDYLYFANADKLNTALFGKGIYRVKIDGSNSLSAGEKFIEETYSINSIAYYGGKLYFTSATDLHLYYKSISGNDIIDLMDGFVVPEAKYYNLGGQNKEIDGQIYYLNMGRGKTLCCYDPVYKTNSQLTTEKVNNFSVIGDYIYMNTITYFVNNDLYRFNYKTGGSLEHISSDSAVEIVGNDNFIYYVKDNAASARTSIEKVELTSGSYNTSTIYSKGVKNLRFVNDTLYAIYNSEIVTFDVSKEVTDVDNPTSTLNGPKKVDLFEVEDGYLYYSYSNSLSPLNSGNSLRRARLNNLSDEIKLAEEDIDPVEFVIKGDTIYFVSDTAMASTDGLYSVKKNATEPDTHFLVKANNDIQDIEIYNNNLYYLSSGWGSVTGDQHVYEQSLTDINKAAVRIDDSGF